MLQLQKRGCGEQLHALCLICDSGTAPGSHFGKDKDFCTAAVGVGLRKTSNLSIHPVPLQVKLSVSCAFIDVCYQEIIYLLKGFKDVQY